MTSNILGKRWAVVVTIAAVLSSVALGASASAALGRVGSVPGAQTMPAGGNAWLFPGQCMGADTLQHCIDDATNGDLIQVDTDTPIPGSVTISKSISLNSAPGFHATILGGAQITATSGTLAVYLHDLSFDGGVQVTLTGGADHYVTLDHLTVTNGTTPGAGLSVYTSVPSTVDLTSSSFHLANGPTTQVVFETGNDTGTARFDAIGNKLDGHGNATSSGGIQLILDGPGAARADILDNSIWDVGGCGCVGGAGVYYRVNDPATDDINVVGNTFDRAVYGVYVQTETNDGGTYGLDLFDNIISHTTDQGISIGFFTHASDFTLRSGDNDFSALGLPNDYGQYSGSSSDLTPAPAYVSGSTGNLALKSTSPLIDRGVVCSPGGVATVDAAGNSRLAGPTVDIGAYEHGAVAPNGMVFIGTNAADTSLGTNGRDILCGYGGADILEGNGGNDYIDGGSGSDVLIGGSGADRIFGRGGNDDVCSMDGVHGNDAVDGGPGSDGYRIDSGDTRTNVEHKTACKQPRVL